MIDTRERLWGLLLVALWGLLSGCAMQQTSPQTGSGLPADKLGLYSDSFDSFRPELWDKAGYIQEPHLASYKQADLWVADGKVTVKTKPGFFSKGGLALKPGLRGDFDVQVDCQIDFQMDLSGMDQVLLFGALEKGGEAETMDGVFVGLFKRRESLKSFIFCAHRLNKTYQRTYANEIGDFDGTLRIARVGDNVTAFYKERNDDQWTKMSTFPFSNVDIMPGFKVQNYTADRTSIEATTGITATFDNFRINAAQEIVEPEI